MNVKLLGGILFPTVTKAGLGIGGQFGEGALLEKGKAVAYYNTAGASVGLQAGEGLAKTLTTTTAKDDVYAFIFGQKGLMAGLGIQGNKITKINPK